jgi:hypothetical protein
MGRGRGQSSIGMAQRTGGSRTGRPKAPAQVARIAPLDSYWEAIDKVIGMTTKVDGFTEVYRVGQPYDKEAIAKLGLERFISERQPDALFVKTNGSNVCRLAAVICEPGEQPDKRRRAKMVAPYDNWDPPDVICAGIGAGIALNPASVSYMLPSGPLSARQRAYVHELRDTINELDEKLREFPVKKGYGSPGNMGDRFAQNQAEGEWGEWAAAFVIGKIPGIRAVHYGQDGKLFPGDEGFAERWRADRRERVFLGKRPDALIYPSNSKVQVVKRHEDVLGALAAVEVKYSSQTVGDWNDEQALEEESKRKSLSFTPKIEDELPYMARWIASYGVPHYYMQVFTDRIYAIETLEMLKLFAQGKGVLHNNPSGSTELWLPLDYGHQVADIELPPVRRYKTKRAKSGSRRIHWHVPPKFFGDVPEIHESAFRAAFKRGLRPARRPTPKRSARSRRPAAV